MRLATYLDLVGNLINSRKDLQIERFTVQQFEGERSAFVEGRLRFWDNSLLRFSEELIERGAIVAKQEYVYHYQEADNSLIFRYDNSPHYPALTTFPHHKHTGQADREQVEPSWPPSLVDILREIDSLLYSA